MTARKITLFLLVTLFVVISTTTMRAQSGAEQEAAQPEAQQAAFNERCDWPCQLKERQAQQLEGLWVLTISIVLPPNVPALPSFSSYNTFARGGVAEGKSRRNPLSQQMGVWVHQGGNEFAALFVEDLFDAAGNFAGTRKVRERFILTGKDEFVGVGNVEERNAAGEVTATRCSTIKAQRIAIEPLSPQCQSINPFQ